ncbi:K(+) efflux antiporter 2, chloroplastic [Tetrabaena socialis]|uniref:K(+) efflux antiporter 2, chloroplastic n=1 Tax=Tetrabaena socialis TaxID=47790 RepID=A0A2J7ZU78_9CHLO|nr:K(+) efflux antiporter 2, chloroplastic [Tetrabaena socialis]|eukprot:PNH03790.1 K(+) efflux antiporter 2, chloroplastic [Tetrabaena socialis]
MEAAEEDAQEAARAAAKEAARAAAKAEVQRAARPLPGAPLPHLYRMRPPAGTAAKDANGLPERPPIPPALSTVDITEKLGSSNPLLQALISSRGSLLEAQRVREALEAEAQEVAQGSPQTPTRVVLLLFNIGLELSLDRLQSMAKFVFGMGTAQVVLTLLAVAGVAMVVAGLPGPAAIILGGALAMSSTAVAIQVLEERGEMGSRHGRAIFSVLLLQAGVSSIVDDFRRKHLSELQVLSASSGTSLGYGFDKSKAKEAGGQAGAGGGPKKEGGGAGAGGDGVVALSMAMTPYLAEFGSRMGAIYDSSDLLAMQPKEDEMKEMKDHVIIAGFGRVGQIIAQMLSEQLIPFVALDVSSARVAVGKKKDVPVFFGDAADFWVVVFAAARLRLTTGSSKGGGK